MKNSKLAFLLLVVFSVTILFVQITAFAEGQSTSTEKILLRYRIEIMAKNQWKPIKDTKSFKKNDTIRFRFWCNQEGSLYVLNSSNDNVSLKPVFEKGSDPGLRKFLGMGTYIEAGHVGIFPNPEEGGGLRFSGGTRSERFLFIFIPYELEQARAMMGVVAGAENWTFEEKTTYRVTGEPGNILFHYFELTSK